MNAAKRGDLGARTTRSAALMSAQTMVTKVATTLGQLALAAILLPEAFGLIALAFAVRSYASVIQEAGIREVLIREQERLGRWANAGFWLVTTLGFAAAALMILIAWPASMLLTEPGLVGLILVLAGGQPAMAMAIVPQAVLERDMRFKWVALVEGLTAIGQMLLTVALAWMGFEAYSFAIAVSVAAWARFWMLWIRADVTLRGRPQMRRWPRFFKAGLPTSGAAVLERTVQQSDYLILGIISRDPGLVGHYFFAFNQSTMVSQLLVGSLVRILVSSLSALKDDVVRQVNAFLQATRVLAIIAIPLGVLQATLARPFLTLLFGERWAPAIPLLEILSIIAGFGATCWPAISLLMAQGRYVVRLWLRLGGAIVFVAFALAGTLIGRSYEATAIGLALGVSAFRLINGPIVMWVACKPGGTPMVTILRVLFTSMIGASVTLIPIALLTRWGLAEAGVTGWQGHVAHLCISPALGLPLYWAWCKVAQPGDLRSVGVQFERILPARIMRRVPRWVF